ncbi:MAG: AMP-binding protein [Beijerinckiaceae bacterium]|nr:AMP-binding protein [Beijerinckiaceae bacterium]
MTIGSSLARFAQDKPHALALVCDDEMITWGELWRAVQSTAEDLESRAPAGRSVALILKNSPLMLAHFLACAVTGREAAVIDPTWPHALIMDALQALAPALVYGELACGISGAITVNTRGALPCRECDFQTGHIDSDLSFYVGFTSGSTGRPKGYRRSHRSWLESFEGDRVEFGVTQDDVILAPGSMTHSLFLYAAVHALHIGATILISRSFHPGRALRMARKHGATVAYGAPTQLRMLIDTQTEPLSMLRWVLSSGAKWFGAVSDALARRAPNARFAEFYGASELSFVAVRKSGESCPEDSVGRAFANVNISVRNDDGDLLAPGKVGRIFAHSPYLFMGYATGGEAITRHGVEMSVGDMGFLDSSGFLHLVGRADRMIVTSGKNVFAEEIEGALEQLPQVRAAAVFGVPDQLRGQKIIALVLHEKEHALRRAEVTRNIRSLLPSTFIPHLIAIPFEWRWTSSGKTDFNAMRALWDEGAWEEAP